MPITLISGILILVGLVGIAVPVLPCLVLVWLSVLLWAFVTHSPTGWAVLAVATALTVLGFVARYLVPGRRLRAAGVPPLTTVGSGPRRRRLLRDPRGGGLRGVRAGGLPR